MEYLFQAGFLGTRAPYFIDIITLIIVALPVFLIFAVVLAVKRYYKLHQMAQSLLFTVTLIAFLLLQYEIQIRSSFETLIANSTFNPQSAFYYYMVYSIVALMTFLFWYSTLAFAKADRQRRALPGLYSRGHKRLGRLNGIAVLVTSLMTAGLYWILFVL
ncbi:MAG: hypothetical protein IE889_00995 [Campylobacterales bacterium]|nr:hypothetical protein [Campylobacterales bacterium]